ncbi:MAG: AraC family transcriptional regulator [Verrucomicrobiae bacterium]|nr:AraC family transcriptional regulator [Verrucomicrobiae bacterium]
MTPILPPIEYLQNLRMERARQLLISTDQPVADIAAAVGYEEACHFSRLFKKTSGASPQQYRQKSTTRLWKD